MKKQTIRDIREKSRKYQFEMAELLGMSRATYIKCEKGIRKFSIEEAIKLSTYFGVNINEVEWNVKPK